MQHYLRTRTLLELIDQTEHIIDHMIRTRVLYGSLGWDEPIEVAQLITRLEANRQRAMDEVEAGKS
jgi:hypothetical protein